MFIRRIVAQARRRVHSHIWPINEAAGKRPANWPGWPNGKKFALVLTHDVESSHGLAKCRKLMHLEQSLGVRSSFNFIPEGDYNVPPELRQELHQNGFEVGVHDLRHDGKLFWQTDSYSEKTQSINGYINDWQAHGFRSGFMFHNREFLNKLDILYDASTFDTDPFEPQPEGAGTIFPFWVPGPGGGYVELPYTLPQDSTLFLVLNESSSEIWKRKLDWIVARGGMALINVHPDYLGFNGRQNKNIEYPSAFYAELIRYVQEKYADQYWNPLPHEIAGWYKQNCQPRPVPQKVEEAGRLARRNGAALDGNQMLSGKNVGVVLFSYYLSDPRPRRAAELLAKHGASVEVICLRANDSEPKIETVNGVRIQRVPLKRLRGSKLTYVYQYLVFIACSFWLLALRCFRQRVHLVHAHNMPDVLVFSALVPKLLGAKVILDLHDPMPELMETIFGLKEESRGVRLLKFLEKVSIGFAHLVLTPNVSFKKLFTSRSCPAEKIDIVMNSPNEEVFRFRPVPACASPRDPARPFVILYHGSLVARHGLDLAVDALEMVRKTIPAATLTICGDSTPYFEQVMDNVRQRGLQDAVRYEGVKSHGQIVEAIEKCDLGVIPNRRSVFTEINMPTRIFEYLVLGKPVLAPRTQGIQDYFDEQEIIFFDPDNVNDLARKMEFAAANAGEVRSIVERGQAVYQKHRWAQESSRFLERTCKVLNNGR